MSSTKPICIYHGNCADGFTAAWAVWKLHGDAYDYHAGVYQDPPPDVAGRHVLMVDFSYKRAVIEEMRKSARSIRIIDHHKSAIEDLTGKLDDSSGLTPIELNFDLERSGAGLAWDIFHPNTPRPKLVTYVEDRDLWRFNWSFSREISAYVFSHEYSFAGWSVIAEALERSFDRCVAEGAAIERKHHKDVAELVGALRSEMIIGGQWAPVANLPYTLTSDAGHLMCQPYASPNLHGDIVTPPFAACYWDTPDGRVFSLRSIEGGADVSEIAKQYGGGGHRHAAGFRLAHGVNP